MAKKQLTRREEAYARQVQPDNSESESMRRQRAEATRRFEERRSATRAEINRLEQARFEKVAEFRPDTEVGDTSAAILSALGDRPLNRGKASKEYREAYQASTAKWKGEEDERKKRRPRVSQLDESD